VGYNTRLDELQAAILRVKLKRLDTWNEKRRQLAAVYTQDLKGAQAVCPVEASGRKHIYHLYSIRSSQRDALRDYLETQGISTGLHYPAPLHLQNAMNHLGYKRGDFPVSEQLAQQVLSLPLYAQLAENQVHDITKAIHAFEKRGAAVA